MRCRPYIVAMILAALSWIVTALYFGAMWFALPTPTDAIAVTSIFIIISIRITVRALHIETLRHLQIRDQFEPVHLKPGQPVAANQNRPPQ